MSTPITDIATADAELTRLVNLLRLQEKMLAREVSVVREWLEGEDALSEIVTATEITELPRSRSAADYINRAWEGRTPAAFSHAKMTEKSDRDLVMWDGLTVNNSYAGQYAITPTSHPLGQRMARFLSMSLNMSKTKDEWNTVGRQYGRLVEDEPKAADGLYLHASTSRRDTVGWANTTARTKSSFAVTADPLGHIGAFSRRGFWHDTFSIDGIDRFVKNKFVNTVWDFTGGGSSRYVTTVNPTFEWNSVRYSMNVTVLTVLLPRAHAAARRAEVEGVMGHLSTMFTEYKSEVDAINDAKEDVELAALAKEIQGHMDELTEPDKWRDIRISGKGAPRRTFIETVAALPNIDDIIDEVRTKVWTERHGSVPTEAELTAAAAVDRSPVEDDDYLTKKWAAYTAANSVPEFTY